MYLLSALIEKYNLLLNTEVVAAAKVSLKGL